MRLEIEEQDGVAVGAEQPRPLHHAQPVGAHAVHQDHHPARARNPAEPPPQSAPGRARDLDRLGLEIRGRRSDHSRDGRGEGMADIEEDAGPREETGQQDQGEQPTLAAHQGREYPLTPQRIQGAPLRGWRYRPGCGARTSAVRDTAPGSAASAQASRVSPLANCDIPPSNCVTAPANCVTPPTNCAAPPVYCVTPPAELRHAIRGLRQAPANFVAPLAECVAQSAWGMTQFARAVPQFAGAVWRKLEGETRERSSMSQLSSGVSSFSSRVRQKRWAVSHLPGGESRPGSAFDPQDVREARSGFSPAPHQVFPYYFLPAVK